jgi:hypothetical protein
VTYLIDEKGKIAAVWPKVKPDEHAARSQFVDALRESVTWRFRFARGERTLNPGPQGRRARRLHANSRDGDGRPPASWPSRRSSRIERLTLGRGLVVPAAGPAPHRPRAGARDWGFAQGLGIRSGVFMEVRPNASGTCDEGRTSRTFGSSPTSVPAARRGRLVRRTEVDPAPRPQPRAGRSSRRTPARDPSRVRDRQSSQRFPSTWNRR